MKKMLPDDERDIANGHIAFGDAPFGSSVSYPPPPPPPRLLLPCHLLHLPVTGNSSTENACMVQIQKEFLAKPSHPHRHQLPFQLCLSLLPSVIWCFPKVANPSPWASVAAQCSLAFPKGSKPISKPITLAETQYRE